METSSNPQKTDKEKMLNGELYFAEGPELLGEKKRAKKLIRQFNESEDDEDDKHKQILKELLGSFDENIKIKPNFSCDYGHNIHLGENFYTNHDCFLLDVCEIRIGKNCMLGPGVQIYTASYPLDVKTRLELEFGKKISISDNVWIGGSAIILPGVKIGNGAVVAAGAVVSKDVPDNVVVARNPAKIIKKIENN